MAGSRTGDGRLGRVLRLAVVAGLGMLAIRALGSGGRAPGPGGGAPRPDVVLIVIDTLRADAVGLDDAAPTAPTPFLAGFARTATVYSAARSAAPWTAPSHASIFTGLRPRHHGFNWLALHLPDEHETLAEVLARHGYRTAAFAENPWIGPAFGMTRGFAHLGSSPAEFEGPVAAAPVLASLRAWVRGLDRASPAFVFVNVVDPHAPYGDGDGPSSVDQDPASYICADEPAAPARLAALAALYRADVRRADEKIERVLGIVGERIPLDGALVVITADHGELLGEHGLVSHQFGVYEELLHVPLLVHLPGQTTHREEPRPVSLVDVAPSILAVLGLPWPDADGEDVFTRSPPPRVLVSSYRSPRGGVDVPTRLAGAALFTTIRMRRHCPPGADEFRDLAAASDGRYKLVRVGTERLRLFDLHADPGELVDVAREHPGVVRRLARYLPSPAAPATPAAAAPRPSPRTVERLRSLGYVDDAGGP